MTYDYGDETQGCLCLDNVDSLDARQNNQHTSKYKWHQWFNRDFFTLTRGVDYEVRTSTMVQMVRNHARPSHFNVYVSIKVAKDEGSFSVTVLKRDLVPPRKPASARNGLKRRVKVKSKGVRADG